MEYKNILDEELRIAGIHIAELSTVKAAMILSQWEDEITLSSLTLYYDYKQDYIVLNLDLPDHDFYYRNTRRYLLADAKRRSEIDEMPLKVFKDERRVLRDCLEKRTVKRELEIVSKNWIEGTYWGVLRSIDDKKDRYVAFHDAFIYGMICGKREERARRKRGIKHES